MDKSPLISFIIPIHNIPAEMICECIDSIRNLTLRSFEREIIVIDDGSDESPIYDLWSMADDIIYIRQKNEGVSTARNVGLRMATGRYIQFIDGDDMLLPVYEHIIDLLRFDKADMVMFDFTNKKENIVDYTDKGPVTGSELLRKSNIHGSVWSFVFKCTILGSLRFTPGIAYGEDEEFTPQLLLRAEQVFVSTAKAYFYRRRLSSAVNNRTIRKKLQRLNDTMSVILHLQKLEDTLPLVDRMAIHRRTAQLTMDYIYNIIVLTHNKHYLEKRLTVLRQKGLFPLPDINCTTKYTWFRRMSNTSIGRTILMRTLPLLKRER